MVRRFDYIEGIHLCHFKLVMVAGHHVFEVKVNGPLYENETFYDHAQLKED